MKITVEQIIQMKKEGISDEVIIAFCNASTTTTTKAPIGTNAKAPSKGKAPKKGTNSKAPSTFDRDLYVAKARELGCYNEEYGKVTATVKDGKVIRTAKKNRELVYAEMAK